MSKGEWIFAGIIWGMLLIACVVKWQFEIKIGRRL